MSSQFSDTTNKNGIIQNIESNVGFKDGDISGNAVELKKWTTQVNLALDWVIAIILRVSGKWQFDDSNHTKYPIITTNIVSGQRDYAFVLDEQSNLLLGIHKVMVKNSATGYFQEIFPVDVQSDSDTEDFYSGVDATGVPMRYDKTANGIFLDPIPSYNSTGGLKIYINREGSYFASSDTTKKPGFAGLFHDYLAIRPSYFYFLRKKMFDSAKFFKSEMLEMEDAIKKHYRDRAKDDESIISSEEINSI